MSRAHRTEAQVQRAVRRAGALAVLQGTCAAFLLGFATAWFVRSRVTDVSTWFIALPLLLTGTLTSFATKSRNRKAELERSANQRTTAEANGSRMWLGSGDTYSGCTVVDDDSVMPDNSPLSWNKPLLRKSQTQTVGQAPFAHILHRTVSMPEQLEEPIKDWPKSSFNESSLWIHPYTPDEIKPISIVPAAQLRPANPLKNVPQQSITEYGENTFGASTWTARSISTLGELIRSETELLAPQTANSYSPVTDGDADPRRGEVLKAINHKLSAAGASPIEYADLEQAPVEEVRSAVLAEPEPREYDVFISYARVDGEETAEQLKNYLQHFGVSVWFDREAIRPGESMARQMDRGLQKAKAGIVLVTPQYLIGRFWTERELGVLLHKPVVIPVLHDVTFKQVAEYSSFLSDLAGFETGSTSLLNIAARIASAVLTEATRVNSSCR